MLFYLKRNKNPNSSPRIQLTSLNKELYSLRNNSIDFAVKWRNSFIKFSNKIQTTGSSASYWAENENDKNLYECLNEISIYLTDFETQSKSWLSCQKNWINLLKELSENETNYINKEKEYFKILSKLHDITKQIRNYDQELQENSNHENNNNNNNNNNNDNNDNDNDNDNDNNKNNTKEPKKSKSSLLSLGKNSKKDVLISNNNKNRKEQSGKGEIEEEINEKIEESEEREKNNSKRNNERNHMEKEEDLNDQKIIKNINKTNNDNKNETSNINDNDNNNNNNNDNVHNNNNNNNNTMTKGIKSKSIVIRNKNSYHHLIHVQNKLKKEFLKYFNENQKQLDTIYLIKELKVPTTLYKLIQESSKMWNHFIKTYGKFEESLNKLQNSEDEDEIIKNKNSIDKLNLNFDHQEEVIDRMNKESEYVKKYSPTKTQLENIKVWMKNSIKWIKSLEETFNYQKNHIQFVSKWLHESYKNHIFEKQISMLKLNDIVNQKSTHHHSSPSTSNTNKIENEDSEFIHTIINIYNNRINKNNSKYYNILYKTSLADKKRDEFLRNCEWNKTLIGTSSDKEDNYDSKNKNKSKSKSKNRKKKRSNDDDNDNDDDDKHEYNNNNDNGHDNDDDDDDNDDHNSDNEHHKSKHKHEHPQENQINNMIMTQKNKYSHHHIHLSYIYLFQTFGELTNALEENILSNVNIFNQIYSQIINRYGDLKKQSNIVWKIVNDIKKNIHAYHDEKIFHVIKSKKKQKNRLRKLSHDFEIQKYKLDSMIREFYEFKRNEILHEYGKIIESVKGSSYEYLELCSNIITEYDILNSKKAHKEKELMAKKLIQLTTTKHEKLEIKNNLNENINSSNSSSKKNLSKHDDKTKSISEKEIGKVKVKEKDKEKDKEKEKEREKRKLEELKEKMMKASKEKIVNATFLEKKTTSEKTISKKTKTGRNDNTHGKKNSNDNDNSNNNSNSNSTKKKKGHRSNSNNKKERSKEKFDIISIIESGEALDSYDLTSNKINDYYQTPMVYTYEESIPEDNHSAVINMLHNLPNTVNDNIPISPKNSISKSKASSIKSKKEYDYNYDFSYEPNYHNNNNNNSNNNINYSVTSHNNNNYNYGFGYDYSYNHLNHDIHQNINSNTNRTGDLTTATTTTTMIATTTTTTTTTTPTATATAIAPMMNPLATLTLTPTITTESPPATPPPQYTSPKWKKSMTLGAGATLYYPGPPPPPPVPAITSEFPNFLNQVATAASPSTLDQIMPGSRPGLNPNDGNSQPSAPPMDSYMYNLRSNVNII